MLNKLKVEERSIKTCLEMLNLEKDRNKLIGTMVANLITQDMSLKTRNKYLEMIDESIKNNYIGLTELEDYIKNMAF